VPTAGLTRLFTGEFGFESAGCSGGTARDGSGAHLARPGPAHRPVRAAAILFGGWMLVDGLILSYMKTMVHPYYCLSFVPAVAGMFASACTKCGANANPGSAVALVMIQGPASGAGGSLGATATGSRHCAW
jgi:hypothetical protein